MTMLEIHRAFRRLDALRLFSAQRLALIRHVATIRNMKRASA